MFEAVVPFILLLGVCQTQDYYYLRNVTRSTLSGIQAYRSLLTLDWLATEDTRQRELAAAFETEAPPSKIISSDCIDYPRPSAGKIGRHMLELLKNLEGDEGVLISELIQVLIRTKLLLDTSVLESEPDLESLVKTPTVMMGEPYTTFPRIMAVVWILVTDPFSTKRYGWCPIKKVNQYLMISKPSEIAKQMRSLEIVIARARFVMEEFIQSVTPIKMYQKKSTKANSYPRQAATQKKAMKPLANEKISSRSTSQTPELKFFDVKTEMDSSPCSKLAPNSMLFLFILFLY